VAVAADTAGQPGKICDRHVDGASTVRRQGFSSGKTPGRGGFGLESGRAGSPYATDLIAEKQGFVRSMSENGRGELRHEEEILQSETSDRDMATKIGEVVLVGLTDLLTMP
jgi:hypothetical protein